jgi:Tfp pilus assembly protein PilV
MSYFKNSSRGFTLVEILISSILLIIAAAAFFAVFVSMAKLRVYSSNELRMLISASSWLEKVRTGSTSATEYDNLAAQAGIDLNSDLSIFKEDYINKWIIATKSNVDMTGSGKGALYTTEENVNLDSGANFKKITITVLWDERT